MYDMSVPNSKPGTCAKCNGTGTFQWAGGYGKVKSGPCHACRATGKQTVRDMYRNEADNRHKLSRMVF